MNKNTKKISKKMQKWFNFRFIKNKINFYQDKIIINLKEMFYKSKLSNFLTNNKKLMENISFCVLSYLLISMYILLHTI